MIRLGINVDHVATVRNARGEAWPSPVQAALEAQLGGADNITCHLREDRRHIRDRDVQQIKDAITVPLNFEMAATDEMVEIACSVRPAAVTIVPEKREELTTEGGLDVRAVRGHLEPCIGRLRDAGILVSLFVDPDPGIMELCADLGAGAVEIHTGEFCRQVDATVTTAAQWDLLDPFLASGDKAHNAGMQVHVGHGLHYHNAWWMQALPWCEEANIGHAVVSRALFSGLRQAVADMKDLLNNPAHKPVRRQ